LVLEALAADLPLHSLVASEEFLQSPEGRELLPKLPQAPIPVVAKLLDEMAESDSPRGLLALAHLPRGNVDSLPLVAGGLYLFTDGLQNPGNLGALARVAEAAGATALCLGHGTAHPNHPRALRASAGSLLRLPVAQAVSWQDLQRHLAPLTPRCAALSTCGGQDIYSADLAGTLLLALGAEGPGLSQEVQGDCQLALTIPLAGRVESLNATVAAALVLFERRRSLST
jgi:TrmH family RNA methyltransferase